MPSGECPWRRPVIRKSESFPVKNRAAMGQVLQRALLPDSDLPRRGNDDLRCSLVPLHRPGHADRLFVVERRGRPLPLGPVRGPNEGRKRLVGMCVAEIDEGRLPIDARGLYHFRDPPADLCPLANPFPSLLRRDRSHRRTAPGAGPDKVARQKESHEQQGRDRQDGRFPPGESLEHSRGRRALRGIPFRSACRSATVRLLTGIGRTRRARGPPS